MHDTKGIVFDLDDTLYPQKSFKRSGFRVVARWLSKNYDLSESVVLIELEKIMGERGPSYPFMFNELANRLPLEIRVIPKLVNIFIAHEPKISVYPGVQSMLTRLGKRYKLGILTDGRLDVQRRKIHALGLCQQVDEILCSDEIGLEKPNPLLFEWFEEHLRIKGEKLMYVGDNPAKDFLGAKERNWTTVRILSGEHIQKSHLESQVDGIFSRLEQYEKQLTSQNRLEERY